MLMRIQLPPMPKGVTDEKIWRTMWCSGLLELPEGMTQEEVWEKLYNDDVEFQNKYCKLVGGMDPDLD